MWLALYPLLGKRVRNTTLVLGVAWTLLMSLAVVGALWHTPLDALGSILLSVGIVTAGAAVFEPPGTSETLHECKAYSEWGSGSPADGGLPYPKAVLRLQAEGGDEVAGSGHPVRRARR